jgi:hypothetical protein
MIFELICVGGFLTSFSIVSIYALKVIYIKEVKNLKEYTNEAVNLIDYRLEELYNRGELGNEEHKQLVILKKDLLKTIKDNS